jgi:hypothetical protein
VQLQVVVEVDEVVEAVEADVVVVDLHSVWNDSGCMMNSAVSAAKRSDTHSNTAANHPLPAHHSS